MLLAVTVLSFADLVEIIPALEPVTHHAWFPFIHATHIVLSMILLLYIGHRVAPRLGLLGVGWLLIVLAPYIGMRHREELPEIVRLLAMMGAMGFAIYLSAVRKQLQDVLHELAIRDPVTGLLNRRQFERELARQLLVVERYRIPAAVVYLDLDKFKAVNDSLGHQAGDRLLIGIAEILKQNVRATDVAARLGGDESALILTYTSLGEAKTVAERLALAYAHLPSRQPEGHVERKVSLIRLLILFALLPILWWDVVSPETKIVLIGLTALLACYILGALIILPRLRGVLRQDVFLTIDILAIAALVWYTGGINSSLLFLFYLPVLAAAIRLELREAILSAVAVSGIVIWMWNVAEGGLPSLGSTTLRVGLFTGSSLVTALIFGIMAQESRLLKEHGRKNRELNDKLTESTDQLRRRLGELEFAYELSRKLAVVTDTAAVLVKVTEAAQHLLRAPYGAVFLTNHTAGDLDLAYVHGLTDRDAVQLMRVCAGKVTADTTSPVTVEIQDAPWLRAVCTPIILAGRLQGILCAG